MEVLAASPARLAATLAATLALVISACADARAPLGAPHEHASALRLAQDTVPQDTTCTVEIRGPSKVCLDCVNGQPSIVLTAVGTPGGGGYTWGPAAPGADKVTLTPRGDRVFVKGIAPSGAPGDVTVPVSYRAPTGAVCGATADLTVVKPTSLGLLAEWIFVVQNGQVVSASLDGVPQGSVPPSVAGDLRPVLEQGLGGKKAAEIVGVIVIRYYEVLDQFGARWTCNGTLTEVVTPKTAKTGGTPVVAGLPQSPDRIFNLEERKKFRPLEILQLIRVSGCDVRRNRFRLDAGAAASGELTPQQYQQALEDFKKPKKPKKPKD